MTHVMPRFKVVNFDRFVSTVSMVLVDLVVFAVRPDAFVCPGRWRNVKAPASTMASLGSHIQQKLTKACSCSCTKEGLSMFGIITSNF